MAKTKYQPEYSKMLLQHMKKGYSYQSFAGVLQICKQTLYNWEKAHGDFVSAKEVGQGYSQLWWETLGLSGVQGKIPKFNERVWAINMRNRFGAFDKAGSNWPPKYEIIILDPSSFS